MLAAPAEHEKFTGRRAGRGYHGLESVKGVWGGCGGLWAPLGGSAVEPKFKLVTSNDPELFEQRLNDLVASLDRDDIVVDIRFATTAVGSGIEYSAVVHYQTTDDWQK